jgi:drug/metabolite transporter (DMT)-like permease
MNEGQGNDMSVANWLLLVLTAATFASSLFFNHVIVTQIPPITVAALRAVLACPLAWLFMRCLGHRLPSAAGDRRALLVAGLGLVVVPFSAIAWGQQYIPSGLGGILYGMMPLFTIVAAHFLVADQPMTARKLAGVLVGICGIIFVVGPSALVGLGKHLAGELITLVAPASYALGSIYLRRYRHIHPLVVTAGMFIGSSLVLIPLSLLIEGPWPGAALSSGPVVSALCGLAIIGTAVPALLNYMLLQRAGVTNASLVMFFMPTFAVAFGAVLLNETLQGRTLLGMSLILAGSLLVTRPRRIPAVGEA